MKINEIVSPFPVTDKKELTDEYPDPKKKKDKLFQQMLEKEMEERKKNKEEDEC